MTLSTVYSIGNHFGAHCVYCWSNSSGASPHHDCTVNNTWMSGAKISACKPHSVLFLGVTGIIIMQLWFLLRNTMSWRISWWRKTFLYQVVKISSINLISKIYFFRMSSHLPYDWNSRCSDKHCMTGGVNSIL